MADTTSAHSAARRKATRPVRSARKVGWNAEKPDKAMPKKGLTCRVEEYVRVRQRKE